MSEPTQITYSFDYDENVELLDAFPITYADKYSDLTEEHFSKLMSSIFTNNTFIIKRHQAGDASHTEVIIAGRYFDIKATTGTYYLYGFNDRSNATGRAYWLTSKPTEISNSILLDSINLDVDCPACIYGGTV